MTICTVALYDLRERYAVAERASDASIVVATTLLNAAATSKIAFAESWRISQISYPNSKQLEELARQRHIMFANLDLIQGISIDGPAAEHAGMLRAIIRDAITTKDLEHITREFSTLLAFAASEGEEARVEAASELRMLFDSVIFSVLGAALISTLVYAWMGLGIARPVRRLLKFADAVSAGEDAPEPPKASRHSDLGRLTHAFNRMISVIKADRERLEHLAYTDQETGLPNRPGFMREAQRRLEAEGAEHNVAILRFPRLPQMEGLFGRGYGRQAEIAVSERLRAALQSESARLASRSAAEAGPESGGDILAGRLRFDTFVVLGRDVDVAMADRLRGAFEQPAQVGERVVRFEPSGSVACGPEHGATAFDMVSAAELALERAKQSGPTQVFTAAMREEEIREREIDLQLRRAIGAGELTAFFQPKICARTGRVLGAEALARWRREDGGLVSPAEFVPAAERLGLVSTLDYAIMRQAVAKASELRASGHDVSIAVNLSAATIEDPRLGASVMEILDTQGLAPEHFEIEITESAAIANMNRARPRLQALRDHGVRVALDDFGTGYCSLASLNALPIDTLKLDRSFVPTDESDNGAVAITEAVLTLANRLRLKTVAEGVETDWQADFVRSRGCDMIQGFLYGRPQPFEDYVGMLETERGGGAQSPLELAEARPVA